MADSREYVTRVKKIPALFVESDLVDPRLWSEAQFKNRIDAFFEALAARKVAATAAHLMGTVAQQPAATT
jgi:benzoyl-CoA reductase subunit B